MFYFAAYLSQSPCPVLMQMMQNFSAAAMNDVERLKGFASKQVSLLQSLDPAQRQPV
jgi:hypothetical protein